MGALEPQHMTVLKKVLAERFVPFLPPLLGAAKPDDQSAKQLSRAFSAFALHKLLNITPKDAAASVVDDFNDKGLDAIHYYAPTETLYLLQTKLKESAQARPRLLVEPSTTTSIATEGLSEVRKARHRKSHHPSGNARNG